MKPCALKGNVKDNGARMIKMVILIIMVVLILIIMVMKVMILMVVLILIIGNVMISSAMNAQMIVMLVTT